jgi:hypothetical protein
MKIPFLITIAGLVIGFAVPAFSQQKETVDPQLAEQLGALSNKSGEAFNSNDAAAVAALYTEDAILVPDRVCGTGPGPDRRHTLLLLSIAVKSGLERSGLCSNGPKTPHT